MHSHQPKPGRDIMPASVAKVCVCPVNCDSFYGSTASFDESTHQGVSLYKMTFCASLDDIPEFDRTFSGLLTHHT